MIEPVIRSIPLDRLEPSPANVRKTTAGEAAFAELKASIATHGLLENLVARDLGPAKAPGADPGQASRERFAVIAGARRLAVLNELAREGVINADHPVPCRVIDNAAPDTELSLAENVVRVAMHPADQVEAFGALALGGATVAHIAARFGVSERTVEQRLRLGHAAPELLNAYREDAIDLETLKAFAVTTDRTRQLAVWNQVRNQGYRTSGWHIKRMLTEDRIPAGAALARYVGVDAYEAAGGAVLRDLFAGEREHGVWLEDPALLMKLALDRLQVAAGELATKWKWAEARVEIQWADLARFGRVRPTPAQPTDAEKAEIERLHVRHDELVNLDEETWTEELIEEAEAIEPRLAAIRDAINARAVFKPEDIAISGCIVTSGYRDDALDIAVRETRDRPPLRVNDDAFGDWSPGEAMLADRSSLPFDWLEIDDRQESFAALRALPPDDKKRLFAACVARTVNGQLAFEADARPELEATVARLDIEFAAHVRPTAEMFWSRVRKDRMLSVACEVLGVEWAHAHAKDKKAVLAAALETAFAKGDSPPLGVTKEGHADALAWSPPGFAAYDAGRIDDEDADAPPPPRAQDVASAEAPQESAPAAATAVPEQDTPAADAEGITVTADTAAQPHTGAGDTDASSDPDPAAPPVATNGHDAEDDLLEIPAFLRRQA